jgi:hypothetical protein
MKNLKLISFSVLLSLLMVWGGLATAQPQPYSPIVVITDLDDTLKVSHVLDLAAASINLPHTDNVFRGMPELFQLLKQRQPQMPFFYLSNAPNVFPFSTFHRKFITENNFPPGQLILRGDLSSKVHKIMKIREIINVMAPQYVLAFGDNGERDIQVYDQIRKEYPAVKFFVYIRQAYGSKAKEQTGTELLENQIGFVTPAEVSMDLAEKRILSVVDVQSILDLIVPPMIRTSTYEDKSGRFGVLSFPHWQDCTDYKWPAKFDDIRWGRDGLYNAIKVRIQQRCSKPPEDQ